MFLHFIKENKVRKREVEKVLGDLPK
jgi:hypothetical protein